MKPELYLWDEHPQQFYPELPHRIYADIPMGPLPQFWWHVSHDRSNHSFTEWVYTDPESAANHLLNFSLDPETSYRFRIQNVKSGHGSYAFAWEFGWGEIGKSIGLYRDHKFLMSVRFKPSGFFTTGYTGEQKLELDKNGWVNRK